MSRRPGYDSTRPPKPLSIDEKIYEGYQRKATQRTLRTATRDSWSRSEICDVLEALGLIKPAPRAQRPSEDSESPSAGHSGAKAAPTERLCGRGLHPMVGGNVYTDPQGQVACRKCRLARRAGRDPAVEAAAAAASVPSATADEPAGDLWCGRELHPMVGDNVAVNKYGKRECRQCRNWRRRRERARKHGIPFDEELS
jgi:hypothetical protein